MSEGFQGTAYQQTFASLFFISCVSATTSSVLILILIKKMGSWNGHIVLITVMSCFQLLYDIFVFNSSIIFGSSQRASALHDVANAAVLIGGLGSGIASNFIAFVAWYVVKYVQSFDVNRWFYTILFCCSSLPVMNCIMYIMSCHAPYQHLEYPALYSNYYMRLASIGINFIIGFATIFQFRRMSKNSGIYSIAEQAIRTLCTRLIYYPIAQAICRSVVAWYDIQYNFNFDANNPPVGQFVGQIFLAILTPLPAVCYLIIFLVMQPNAYECFVCMITCKEYTPKLSQSGNDGRPSGPNNASLGGRGNGSSLHRTSTNYDYNANHSVTGPASFFGANSSISQNYSLHQAEDEELWTLIEDVNKTIARNSAVTTENPISAKDSRNSVTSKRQSSNMKSDRRLSADGATGGGVGGGILPRRLTNTIQQTTEMISGSNRLSMKRHSQKPENAAASLPSMREEEGSGDGPIPDV